MANSSRAGTVEDRILADFIAALEGINGTAVATQNVNQESASGQKVLYLDSTTDFKEQSDGVPMWERIVIIGQDTDEEEVNVVVSKTGSALALRDNLVNTHTVGNAAEVKQKWYYHTVDHTVSWSLLQKGPEASFPVGSVRFLSAAETGRAGGFVNKTLRFQSILLDRVDENEPLDTANDQKYQRLLADHRLAILADLSRGGNAESVRVLLETPIDEVDIEDDSSELPVVGSVIDGEIDFKHLLQNTHI